MAHEIAHNVLSHVQDEKLQAMLGSFLGSKSQQMVSGRGLVKRIHPLPKGWPTTHKDEAG